MGRLIAGFALGAILGYFLGALIGCEVLMPASNLCGLGGAIVGLPLGGIAGAMIARRSGGAPRGAVPPDERRHNHGDNH